MPTDDNTPQADESAAAKTGPNKERMAAARRRSYIQMRLAEVQEQIKGYAGERKTLTKEVAGKQGEKTPEAKQLRDRRNFVAARIEALRSEQKELSAERKTTGGKGGGKGGAKKK